MSVPAFSRASFAPSAPTPLAGHDKTNPIQATLHEPQDPGGKLRMNDAGDLTLNKAWSSSEPALMDGVNDAEPLPFVAYNCHINSLRGIALIKTSWTV